MNESARLGTIRRMETKAGRIKRLRLGLGLTQAGFAEMLGGGVTRGAVGNWERGKGIKQSNIELISERTGATVDWLARGAGEPSSSADLTYHPEPERPPQYTGALAAQLIDIGGTEFAAIPRFDMALSAGPGAILEHQAEPLGFHLIERQWVSTVTRAMPEHLAILRVRGDSMRPTFDDGDWLLIDRTQRRVSVQGVYALRIGEDVWVKRLSLNLREKMVRVISDNPAYPEEQQDERELELIGRVVWIVGRRV